MLRVNGFFGHIQRNHLRSMVMFLGFAVACQLIGMALLVGPLLLFDQAHDPVSNFLAYVERYPIAVFVVSAVLFLVRFFWHVNSIQQNVHFDIVTHRQEPRLCKIIEMQAIAAGIKMPGVGIIEDEPRNAFACGLSERSAVLVVTRGLLQALDDDELEAVVAHEITHIVNGDIQLMAVANVMLSTLYMIKKNNPIRIEDGKQIWLIILMPPFLILFLFSGFITSLAMTLGKLSRLLIASSREFVADAEAVRMTKNPAALISALKRIDGRSQIADLDESVDAMMIDGAVEGAYASHPTIAERIAVLTQHAGAMVHGTGTRKDTRNYGEFGVSTNGIFGQKLETSTAILKSPKKLLVDRVNVDSGVNAFGLSPKMRNMVLLAVVAPMILGNLMFSMAMEDMGGRILDVDGLRADVGKPLENGGFTSLGELSAKPNKNGAPLSDYQKIQRLNKLGPLKARCYKSDGYSVGDRELHRFRTPNERTVARYVAGKEKSSRVKVEKYAAIRVKSHKVVRSSADYAALDKALKLYVSDRKYVLMTMHRFFGHAGLKWTREAYKSPRDQKIVERLKERFFRGEKVENSKEISKREVRKNREFLKDAALLVDNSSDFIPCYARLVLGLPNQTRSVKAIPAKKELLATTLLKSTLRGSK